MSKVRPKAKKPTLDMTPVVDLAFLLVTFFMLTTTFRPEEPVIVDIPSSTAELLVPEADLMTITISKDGQVFFNVDNKFTRSSLLDKMGEKYKVPFTAEDKETFSNLTTFGTPINKLPALLEMSKEERKKMSEGIPTDSLNNQLYDWILFTRMSNPKVRIAIKGDGSTSLPKVKEVIKTLQDQNINRFNLITSLEVAPQ
jgi:biopolymer transport protein ExbD